MSWTLVIILPSVSMHVKYLSLLLESYVHQAKHKAIKFLTLHPFLISIIDHVSFATGHVDNRENREWGRGERDVVTCEGEIRGPGQSVILTHIIYVCMFTHKNQGKIYSDL